MPETIHNPTTDQLEAGGTITGTYYGLRFVDTILVETVAGGLVVGNGVVVRFGRDTLGNNLTIESYTPPEPKPWWETCTGNTWVRCVDIAGEVLVLSAHRFRKQWVTAEARAARNPRRVLIADADTELVVPKAAVDRLRRVHEHPYSLADGIYHAIGDFLAAVDEMGGEK